MYNISTEQLGLTYTTVMWEQVKMPNRHFLRSDIFTVAMVYYFYFRLFSLMNQIVNYICSGHSIPNKSNADLMTLIVTSTTFNLAIFTFSSSTLIWQS